MNLAEYKNLSKIIATYLKLDFQTEVLSRLNSNSIKRKSVFISDEFQEYITTTDADFFSQSREAKCINILATQSYSSFKNALKDEVQVVRFTNKLKNHPVCLTSEGAITLEMEKVINAMPTDQNIKAQKVLEVNAEHPIAAKLKELYEKDKTLLDEYTKVLYSQARLIEGMSIENPTEISNIICDILSK